MNRRLSALFGLRDDDPLAVFVRGATVGAFVGAVIAGSTVWRRLLRRAASTPAAEAPERPRTGQPVEGADRDRR